MCSICGSPGKKKGGIKSPTNPRDHTADRCTQTDRCTPLDVALEIAGCVLKSMGALTDDADKSI